MPFPAPALVDVLDYTGTPTKPTTANQRKPEETMKHAIILTLAIITLLPVPRCRVEHARGMTWLVCPRNAGSYTYDDVYQVPRWRGGR